MASRGNRTTFALSPSSMLRLKHGNCLANLALVADAIAIQALQPDGTLAPISPRNGDTLQSGRTLYG